VRIRAAAKLFLEELQARRSSNSLQRQAERSLAGFASHLRERHVRDVRDVDERHLASFARRLRETTSRRGGQLSATSQGLYLQRVKSFCGFLERRGFLLRNPAADLRLPSSAALPRVVLSVRQAARLMEAPAARTNIGQRDRAILETLYGTGLRRSEGVRLDVADLDLRQKTLFVRNGKGAKDRVVPVPGRAIAALQAYLREVRPKLVVDPAEHALFLTAWWGRRLGEVSLSVLVRRYGRTIGIEGLHPHVLRHACATHLLRGGADVRHVQLILGHRHLKTTGLYTRVVIEDLREVFSRAHPRERPWRTGPRQYNEH
jgi:integrase/recombinase XerD